MNLQLFEPNTAAISNKIESLRIKAQGETFPGQASFEGTKIRSGIPDSQAISKKPSCPVILIILLSLRTWI